MSYERPSLIDSVWRRRSTYLGVLVACGFSIAGSLRSYQQGKTWTAIFSFVFSLVVIGLCIWVLAALVRRGDYANEPVSRLVAAFLTMIWLISFAAVSYKSFVEPDSKFYRIFSGLVFLAGIIGPALVSRTYQRLRDEALKEVRITEISKLRETDFENFEDAQRLRDEKYKIEFQKNRGRYFLIRSIELSNVPFFETFSWRLQPGVNILLGRNGYGKSLLIKSLAAILQRDEIASQDLLVRADEQGFIKVELERDGQPKTIVRGKHRFTESIGKIPILAVPDSRFVNRLNTEIADESGAKDKKAPDVDLAADGARHFLGNLPYGEMFDVLFKELCFDYLERRSFDQPVFDLLQKTIETLTGDEFRFHEVKRVGRGKFTLMVMTEGNDEPLPIQYASQGTLSVLGVVGLIRSYLQSVFPDVRDDELLQQPAIVFVDELDAHLHPLWQQKLTGILRSSFPNTQFVLSAHSPLVVAGCWSNEVAVLRKDTSGFRIEQLQRDFIGTSHTEIYDVIFDLEDFDQNYLQYASRASAGFSNEPRISELERKGSELSELERREFNRLTREEAMILRVATVGAQREDNEDRIMKLEAQVGALKDELKQSGEGVGIAGEAVGTD